jgi:hypothetical protein
MVGLGAYDSGAKQTWRGWQWNRIAERIPKHKRRDAVVVYLVGPDDEDRECAKKKGFSNRNLIAIDIDNDNCRRVRDRGGVAVPGNLADLVYMWPSHTPLAGVVADFTCGHNASAIDFSVALATSYAVGPASSVVAVNLLRGRDSWSNNYRASLVDSHSQLLPKLRELVPEIEDVGHLLRVRHATPSLADIEKHRGHTWSSAAADLFASQLEKLTGQNAQQSAMAFMETMNPLFNSYKSHFDDAVQVMDSVVCTWPFGGLAVAAQRGLIRPPEKETRGYAKMRAKRTEGGNRVKFDYYSIVARLACLTTAREQAPEF